MLCPKSKYTNIAITSAIVGIYMYCMYAYTKIYTKVIFYKFMCVLRIEQKMEWNKIVLYVYV